MMNHTKQHYGHANEVTHLCQILDTIRVGTTKKCRECSVGSKSTATETATTISTDTMELVHDNVDQASCTDNHTIHKNGNVRFVLMDGATGTGKRSLVHAAVHNFYHDTPDIKVQFISGRFQSNTSTVSSKCNIDSQPYSAFREAIRTIVDYMIQDLVLLSDFQTKVLSSFSSNDDMSILTETFPDLRRLMPFLNDTISSKDSTTTTTMVQAPLLQKSNMITSILAQLRCPLLVRFIYSLSSIVPMILLLEDIQNADSSSLMLIKMLLLTEDMYGDMNLLVICTYNNEQCTQKSENLRQLLQLCEEKNLSNIVTSIKCTQSDNCSDSQDGGKCIVKICVDNISWDDVSQWVHNCEGQIKKCNNIQRNELTDFVFHHSNGNPLRVRYLLLFFEYYEPLMKSPINKIMVSQDVSELYYTIFTRQSTDVQNIVKTVSALSECGGEHVSISILETILQRHCTSLLETAQDFGLLEYSPNCPYVRFSRTEFQKAVYSKISISDRPSFHVLIGRRIWENLSVTTEEERMSGLLLVARQLRNHVELLDDFIERYKMSESCFDVAQKAGFWGDYQAATTLLEFSILVLRSDAWRHDLYDTTLVLYNSAAQAYCCLGDYDNMNQIINIIFDFAKNIQDKICAYITRAYAHASQNQLMDSFRTETEALLELGEPVDSNPSGLKILFSLLQTKWAFFGKSDEDILSLPLVENPNDLILMQLLCYAMQHSYIINPEASILLCFKVLRLTIKHGMTGPSAVMLALYGFVMCSAGNFDEGLRYGNLALKLGEQFNSWRPKIYILTYGYIYSWFYPLQSTIEPLERAQQEAFQVGDIDIYSSLAFSRLLALLNSGTSLLQLKPQVQNICECLAQYGQRKNLLFVVGLWDYINTLSGDNENLNISGDIKDVDSAFRYAIKDNNKFVTGYIYLNRAMWSYLSGDYNQSILMAKKTFEQRRFCDYTLVFYEGLALLAAAWSSTTMVRFKYKYRGQRICRELKRWTKRCPANFQNKYLLLKAEICALHGKTYKAIRLFHQSIEAATKEGFIQEKGIAYERLARYEISIHKTKNAIMNIEKAQAAFKDWGATPLVHRLDELLISLQKIP